MSISTTAETNTTINPATLAEFALTEALWSACRKARSSAASASFAPVWVLSEFAKDSSPAVRKAVAENTATIDPSVLNSLAADPVWVVRLATVSNRNTSRDTLTLLANDPVEEVRTAAVEALLSI